VPVTVHAELRRLGQDEFAHVAYEVMGHVFKIHAEFGRFLREEIYHCEIARRCRGMTKVPIEVCQAGFRKFYFIDLLVAYGAVFELKTMQGLAEHHRAQLLQYLLLADLTHGKLVNLRPESVQHEFVNTTLTCADRTSFAVDDRHWDSSERGSNDLRNATVNLLSDLGTCLNISLYEEALTRILGGESAVLCDVEVFSNGHAIGTQPVRLVTPKIAFNVTSIGDKIQRKTEDHLRRFLIHTNLNSIQWINIRQNIVTLKTIHPEP
jgi:GxxExxY protein